MPRSMMSYNGGCTKITCMFVGTYVHQAGGILVILPDGRRKVSINKERCEKIIPSL